MSNFFETASVCDSDNSTESINYNDLTPDEKAEADDYKRFFEKDKYVIRRRLPNNTDKSHDPKKAYYNKKMVESKIEALIDIEKKISLHEEKKNNFKQKKNENQYKGNLEEPETDC